MGNLMDKWAQLSQNTEDIVQRLIKDEDYNSPSHSEKGNLEREIRSIVDSLYDMRNKFHKDYPTLRETELNAEGKIRKMSVMAEIKRAYCPQCGKEIVCVEEVKYLPHTGEIIGKYECECGYKCNLPCAYPRILFTEENGNKKELFIGL